MRWRKRIAVPIYAVVLIPIENDGGAPTLPIDAYVSRVAPLYS
jgi:hypothetical protein